ncbi:MAG: Ldh family oxidoreductase [Actinobacteria bacterium]|nr:Ldh family oxidoreductase [Actinomycetota bacterium]
MIINAERAIAHATELLRSSGVNENAAARTARCIVTSDVWGNPSHGLMRLPFYLQRISMGGVNSGANLRVLSQRGAVTSLDGEDGLGHWQLWNAAELAVTKAKEFGISLVSVKNSSHCGALGVYLYPATDAGQISLIFTNGPAVMPATGGNSPLLSTSPIAAGIPGKPPIIIDLATSAVARGKIAAAAKNGEKIPVGWAVNERGEPITDAQAALKGMLAPLGGPKGFALGLMVEALSAGLSGGPLSTGVPDMFNSNDDAKPQSISHTVISIDPSDLGDAASYDDFAALAKEVRDSGGRVPGAKRIHPQEIDHQEFNLADAVAQDLQKWSEKLGVGALA